MAIITLVLAFTGAFMSGFWCATFISSLKGDMQKLIQSVETLKANFQHQQLQLNAYHDQVRIMHDKIEASSGSILSEIQKLPGRINDQQSKQQYTRCLTDDIQNPTANRIELLNITGLPGNFLDGIVP